jgi:lipopolysaccharide transport system ATP-binding protein
MNPIIKVQGLSKQYRIGTAEGPRKNLREALSDVARSPFERLKRLGRARRETIWALKDVSFAIEPGEVVGLIGRNGAGKSTLLKILSRITEPTAGRVELYGRIGSLLEVGTGFHPELTGRENVFLNGAILGMKRDEIERKFDEIVAFSEIEKFIDSPVKWYSSGMYLRLAFSVAAHLEPEILVLDEVLAVGDAVFRQKCLDKMQEIRQQGSTILFVSHDMDSIARLCPRAIMLTNGCVSDEGPAHDVISAYLGLNARTSAHREWADPRKAPGDDRVRLRAVRVRTEDAHVVDLVDIRKTIIIEIEYDVLKPGESLTGGILCNNDAGVCAFSSADLSPQSVYDQDISFVGRRLTACTIPGNLLTEGAFTITVDIYGFSNGVSAHVHLPDIVGFRIVDAIEGDTARGIYRGPYAGVVRPFLAWTTKSIREVE